MRKGVSIDSYVFEYEGLYLSLRGEHLKVKRLVEFQKNIENLEIFCFNLSGYLNTKKSFPICMFVVKASGKCELYIYIYIYIYPFYKNPHLHTYEKI